MLPQYTHDICLMWKGACPGGDEEGNVGSRSKLRL